MAVVAAGGSIIGNSRGSDAGGGAEGKFLFFSLFLSFLLFENQPQTAAMVAAMAGHHHLANNSHQARGIMVADLLEA